MIEIRNKLVEFGVFIVLVNLENYFLFLVNFEWVKVCKSFEIIKIRLL